MSGLNLFQDDVNTGSARLAVRPDNNMAILKHDSRTGSMSIIVPDADPNDRDSQGSVVDVKSVELAVITYVLIGKGQDIGSNVTIHGDFDLYKYDRSGQSRSLGIFGRPNIYDGTHGDATVQMRLIGIVRSIDKKSVGKLDNEISEYFGDKPMPIFIDLNYTKQKELGKATDLTKPVLLTVGGGKGKALSYDTGHATNYKPSFTAKELPEATETKMADFASEFVGKTAEWLQAIRKNDELLTTLVELELVEPNAFNVVTNTFGLTSIDQFNEKAEKLGEGEVGRDALAKRILHKLHEDKTTNEFDDPADDTPAVAKKSTPATSATAPQSPFDGGETEDADDDDLPF